MTINKTTKTVCLIAAGLVFTTYILILVFAESPLEPGDVPEAGEVASEIPLNLREAFGLFEQKAIFYDHSIPVQFTDPETLNLYLKRLDPAAEYLEPAEYAVFTESQKDRYLGVGMEIEKNEAGQIVCFPYSGSPASAGGVENGDILESVEDQAVDGLSLYKVAIVLKGNEAGDVRIGITDREGRKKNLVLQRRYIANTSVTAESVSGLPIVKIHAFNSGTKRELKAVLDELKKDSVIVLDVRDNPGGDLYKAIDSAMLFLENDKKIVSIKSRHALNVFASTTPPHYEDSMIYIWQNQNTASAAEVFAAALTANQRAESIGTISYGKGVTQDIVELGDGAAIIFTSGYLLPPDDAVYHRRGLTPTHGLAAERPTTEDYIRRTLDLSVSQPLRKHLGN